MMERSRYFLEIAYKGSDYHGWQIQENAHSVQSEIEKALSVILRENIKIMGSGRTDTGVHAIQQFAHFDTKEILDPEDFTKKFNAILPDDIAIMDIRKVHAEAHARFDAIWRSYVYRISLRKDPFNKEAAWILYRKLDIDLMNEAAASLIEFEDFQSFSKVKTEVNHFLCKIKQAHWEQKDHELLFHITANRFLRGMVRAIVGTLVEVGLGKITPKEFEEIIKSKDRKKAKSSAPAQGLYLCQVIYPESLFI